MEKWERRELSRVDLVVCCCVGGGESLGKLNSVQMQCNVMQCDVIRCDGCG